MTTTSNKEGSNNKNTETQIKKTNNLDETNSTSNTNSSSSTEKSQMVWVGETGTKYHHEDCRTLKGKGHPITLEQAKKEGRTACKVCY